MNYIANVVGTRPRPNSPLARKIVAQVQAKAIALTNAARAARSELRPPFNRERHRYLVFERRWHLARKAFHNAGMGRPRQTMDEIIEEVASKHGLRPADLLGPRRTKVFVLPRHEAMYRIAAERSDLSYPRIAAYFDRDHTTVLHGVRKHAKRNGLPSLAERVPT